MHKSTSFGRTAVAVFMTAVSLGAQTARAQDNTAAQATATERFDETCGCFTHDVTKIRATLAFAVERDKERGKTRGAPEELKAFDDFAKTLTTTTLTICAHLRKTFMAYYYYEWETFVMRTAGSCDLTAPRQNVPFLHLQAHIGGDGVSGQPWTTPNSQQLGHAGKYLGNHSMSATGYMWFEDHGVKFGSPLVVLVAHP